MKALDDVSISFKKGEVHALVGENGAGKSTFIKTIAGAIRPDSGEICIGGQTFSHLGPKQAIDLGVAVVYQELIQFEAMTVMDNLFMGMKGVDGMFINDKVRAEKTQEMLDHFNCSVKPTALIRDLSIANRQIIEIIKAVIREARIVIMDEPTAAITVEEQESLYKIVHELKKNDVTVIYISHRLDELFEICDRVSVLRDGQYVTTVNITDVDKDGLIALMVGRELTQTYPDKPKYDDEVVLKVEDLVGNGLKGVNFELHKGEILGFAGLVGAGRTELMHLLYGSAKVKSGKIIMNGKEIAPKNPAEGKKAGIGMVPEDRKFQGCFLDKPLYWNISISNIETMGKGLFVDRKAEMEQAEGFKKRIRIKTPDMNVNAGTLSGGNQQKVVIAKMLAAQPNVLIFDEPTRGIDIGARAEIYGMMVALTQEGNSILMVSSDMEELLGMSERIVVLHEGEQTGTLNREEFSQEKILALASGM